LKPSGAIRVLPGADDGYSRRQPRGITCVATSPTLSKKKPFDRGSRPQRIKVAREPKPSLETAVKRFLQAVPGHLLVEILSAWLIHG
jgi:hypothetical protein